MLASLNMEALHFYPSTPFSSFTPTNFKHQNTKFSRLLFHPPRTKLTLLANNINVMNTTPPASEDIEPEEQPSIDIGYVHSRLLPDGSPDVHFRSAVGGQKLRDIMLDGDIELYGPYDKLFLNCAGGGTCGTCMVEVIEGKHLLSPRTEKEKEKLKKKPKTWRLACQTVVGQPDSRGQLIIQQLPEWKAHEWA